MDKYPLLLSLVRLVTLVENQVIVTRLIDTLGTYIETNFG